MRLLLCILMTIGGVSMVACGDDDGAVDSAVSDSAVSDSAVSDSAVSDSAVSDTGLPDSAVVDSGSADTGVPDATLPDGAMCIPEGGSRAVVPTAPPCCPGLAYISCTVPGAGGECEPCVGSSFCTFCGDGTCKAPENECNCPDDC